MSNFPHLQGTSSTGKLQQWSIRVFPRNIDNKPCGVIETSYGYVGGKIQVNEKVIMTGKNLGKKNATTALEQAYSEANTSWTKKTESGYKPITDEPDEKLDTELVSKGKGINDTVPSPMLAHDYQKRKKDIKFPCYVQPKLDGTRAVAIPGKGLFSRNRKTYPELSHLMSEINVLSHTILDGELYSDTLTFQEIVGLVKKEKCTAEDKIKQLQIKYHVYDIILPLTFEKRLETLQELFKKYSFKHIVFVPTTLCSSETHMKELHSQFVANGYEGIMLRNIQGLYQHSRSIQLQKYKEFMDDDFEITGYEQGQGLEEGCIVWICKTKDGKEFHCRPRGTREERIQLFIHGHEYLGKKLTVRYQELTDMNLPRFPVGISIRDYE